MSQDSLTKFDQPLRAELRPSKVLLSAFGLAYLSVALVWLWVPLSWPGRLTVLVLLAGHFVLLYGLHIKPSRRRAVCALSWDSARGWRLRCRGGQWCPARLLLPAFVSYRLVAVRFRVGRFSCRRVVVVADRLSEDDFRRLRVRLLQSAADG
jgi:hypothetical protein